MQRIPIRETTKYSAKRVKVAGWVNTIRSHGKIIFIDLRDRSGLLQIVFSPNQNPELYKLAADLKPEWVIGVEGTIQKRPPAMVNPKIETGQFELLPEKLEIFSKAKTLPFSIENSGYEISEEKRLKYRYLDLRRERMKKNLILRQKTIQAVREFMFNEGFIEVETPILTKATPEGARDYLVPSRLQPGKFYALPQSPQQYKQLLQVAGIEKYFQIARCFRDEDPRADRQAEFTQIDIEMSFIEREDILNVIEKMFVQVVKTVFPEKRILQIPFPRFNYKEVMEKYKTDRPDLRKNKNNPDELAFGIVYDFPMFEWSPSSASTSAKASADKKATEGKEKRLVGRSSKSEGRWETLQHPFTRPQEKDIRKLKQNPEKALSYQYDFVLNGNEVAGGSLRSYKPEMLQAVFEIIGHKKEEIKTKFGHMLESFEYGVPPHGGIAVGFDRFLMVLLGEKNIREVIAFPKTGDSRDPMMDVPSEVDKEQLKELHIEVRKKK